MEISTVLNTEEAKLNFLKGLIRVAKSDGINDKSEKEFYYLASEALGIGEKYNEELNQAWEDDEKIEVKFNTKEEKIYFLFKQFNCVGWMENIQEKNK